MGLRDNLKSRLVKSDFPKLEGYDDLHCKSPSFKEGMKLEKLKRDGDDSVIPYFLAVSLCDASGKRVYGDDDLEELASYDADALIDLMTKVSKAKGIDVDAAEKN